MQCAVIGPPAQVKNPTEISETKKEIQIPKVTNLYPNTPSPQHLKSADFLKKQQSQQDIYKPYVQEAYLQEHYSPNLQRKKSQKENQQQKLFDNEKSPRLTRKNSLVNEPLIKTKFNETNLQSKATNKIDNTSKTATKTTTAIKAISYSRVFPSFVKKKLKFSPPPEGLKNSDNFSDYSKLNSDQNNSNSYFWRNIKSVKMFRGSLKLKERLLVGVSVATVLFTLLLVVDLQMETGMTGTYFPPSHARVKMAGSEQFNSFRNRILKTNR